MEHIVDRTYRFAKSVVILCNQLDKRLFSTKTLLRQVLKSGTSIGANIEEAQAAQSRADFISKCTISLKESRETVYWLRLIIDTHLPTPKAIQDVLIQANDIRNILGAIVSKTVKNNPQQITRPRPVSKPLPNL